MSSIQSNVCLYFPLSSGEKLSEGCIDLLGKDNTSCITGLEDDVMKHKFFAGLVEGRARAKLNEGYYKDSYDPVVSLFKGTSAIANVGPDDKKSLIKAVSSGANVSYWRAMNLLAGKMGMNIDYLTTFTSKREAVGEYTIEFPKKVDFDGNGNERESFSYVNGYYIYSRDNKPVGAVLTYKYGAIHFCIPMSVFKKPQPAPRDYYEYSNRRDEWEMKIGTNPPVAHFYNEHNFDAYPDATVIYCMDWRLALALDIRLGNCKSYDRSKFFITSSLGEDLSLLDWEFFRWHKVVLLTAPRKDLMAKARGYALYLEGKATSIRVATPILLPYSKGEVDATKIEALDNVERAIYERTISQEDIDELPRAMEKIIQNAVSVPDYKAWGESIGLFKANKPALPEKTLALDTGALLVEYDGSSVTAEEQPHNLSEVLLDKHILPAGYLCELQGDKDAGKSHLLLHLANCFAKGDKFLGFFPCSTSGLGMTTIDCETTVGAFKGRMELHGIDPRFSKFILANGLPDPCALSFGNPNFIEGCIKYAQTNKPHCMAFDNMSTLMGSAIVATGKTIAAYDSVWPIRQEGSNVLFVTHSHDNAKAGTARAKQIGSYQNTVRNQTIMVMSKRVEMPEEIAKVAPSDAHVFSVCFATSKAADVLRGKTIWCACPELTAEYVYLGVSDADNNVLDVNPVLQKEGVPGVKTIDIDAASVVDEKIMEGQRDDENVAINDGLNANDKLKTNRTHDAIIDFLRVNKGSKFSNRDIKDALNKQGRNIGDDAVRVSCKFLVDKNVIMAEGEKSARVYWFAA